MLDNRCLNATADDNSCSTRICVIRVLAILAFILALLVGAIVGALLAGLVLAAIVPLVIFAVTVLLAIFLIWFFVRCKKRTNG